MNWQPFRTAPRDGTWILAARAGECLIIAFRRYDDPSHPILWQRQNGDVLWQPWKFDDGEPDEWMVPTHWMPLPELPEEAK